MISPYTPLYLSFPTAGSDYETGPYNVTFTAGQMYATLIVSTMDDNITELSENFGLVINSTDQPNTVDIGSFHMAIITIDDNNPGTYISAQTCMHTVANVCT